MGIAAFNIFLAWFSGLVLATGIMSEATDITIIGGTLSTMTILIYALIIRRVDRLGNYADNAHT
jgi:hypothetical protein